jgi:hypothetical protein
VRAVLVERDLVGEGLAHTDEGRHGHCWRARGRGRADGWTMMGDGTREKKWERKLGIYGRGSYVCV